MPFAGVRVVEAALTPSIRRVTRLSPGLLAALEDYGREALGDSALDSWLLPVIAGHGLLYICEAGEDIAGAAELIRCVDSDDVYLEGIYIRPRFQGRGYGGELLAGVVARLLDMGFERLLATVDPGNAAGRRLYTRAGFEELDRLPDHYGPGRDRIRLSLDLKGGSK